VKNEDRNSPALHQGEDAALSQIHKRKWLPKLICLFLAFIIWLYVMQINNPEHEETFYSVDVTLINTATLEGTQNLSVYSGYGNTVDVSVVGMKSVISKLSPEDIRITADVSQVTSAGSHSVPIHVELPSGLSLGAVSQNAVQVYCDEKASIPVDVRARISSFTMASRLEMGELETDYDSIVVSGPKEALDEIAYALVTLELGNVNASVTASGKLVLIDKGGAVIENPYLRMSRSEVMVQIPVYTTRTLPLTVAYKHGYFTNENVSVRITPAELELRGDPEVLDKMTEIVVTTLDEKKISGDVTQMVQLDLPDGVESKSGVSNVTLQVAHVGTYTSIFNVTDIDVTGAANINYEIIDRSIAVTVRGTLDQLRMLRTSDFSAVVDLSGYSPQSSGVIREIAAIRIDSLAAQGVYEIGEYSVQVKLN